MGCARACVGTAAWEPQCFGGLLGRELRGGGSDAGADARKTTRQMALSPGGAGICRRAGVRGGGVWCGGGRGGVGSVCREREKVDPFAIVKSRDASFSTNTGGGGGGVKKLTAAAAAASQALAGRGPHTESAGMGCGSSRPSFVSSIGQWETIRRTMTTKKTHANSQLGSGLLLSVGAERRRRGAVCCHVVHRVGSRGSLPAPAPALRSQPAALHWHLSLSPLAHSPQPLHCTVPCLPQARPLRSPRPPHALSARHPTPLPSPPPPLTRCLLLLSSRSAARSRCSCWTRRRRSRAAAS